MMLGNELITIKLYAAMGVGNNLGFWWFYCNPLSPVHPSDEVQGGWLPCGHCLINHGWFKCLRLQSVSQKGSPGVLM